MTLSLSLSLSLSLCLSLELFLFLSFSVCLCVCVSVCLCVSLSFCRSPLPPLSAFQSPLFSIAWSPAVCFVQAACMCMQPVHAAYVCMLGTGPLASTRQDPRHAQAPTAPPPPRAPSPRHLSFSLDIETIPPSLSDHAVSMTEPRGAVNSIFSFFLSLSLSQFALCPSRFPCLTFPYPPRRHAYAQPEQLEHSLFASAASPRPSSSSSGRAPSLRCAEPFKFVCLLQPASRGYSQGGAGVVFVFCMCDVQVAS